MIPQDPEPDAGQATPYPHTEQQAGAAPGGWSAEEKEREESEIEGRDAQEREGAP